MLFVECGLVAPGGEVLWAAELVPQEGLKTLIRKQVLSTAQEVYAA
jgi:hypothetical protein